jgi:hypothetical protein
MRPPTKTLINSLYTTWCSLLASVKEATTSDAKQMLMDDLSEAYTQAQELKLIAPENLQLKLILCRPLKEHLILFSLNGKNIVRSGVSNTN